MILAAILLGMVLVILVKIFWNPPKADDRGPESNPYGDGGHGF